MTSPAPQEVTQLLLAWSNGDKAALDRLIPLVHAELRRLAKICLRSERPGHTLQTSALVNEAYLRLIDVDQVEWRNRAPFFAISAKLMRRILVDFARKRSYQKRGGAAQQVSFDESLDAKNDDQAMGLRLTDALITKLSDGLPRVVVRSTSAVRKYDGDTLDPIAAGREQQVDAVLEASFQRAGDRLRVTARLLRVGDNRQLWAGKFDERVADPFAMQDALTEQAALALLPQLTGEERSRIKKRDTGSAEAFDLYWIGRVHWNKRTPEGMKQTIESFQQAISLDSNYAMAYAGLADAWITLSDYEVIPPGEAYSKAREAAAKAIALDETLAEAHTSQAMISASYDWDWGKAEASFRQALALNPNYPTAHQWYAEYLAAMGRHAEALDEIGQAQRLDPTSLVIRAARAWVLYFARDYDAMIAECRKIIGMERNNPDVYAYLARAYEQKGMYREAMDAWSKNITLAGQSTPDGEAIRASAIRNHDDYWRKRELLERMPPSLEVFNLAETVAQLGGKDEAIRLLEECFAERDYHLMYLKVHPNLDRLRSDARFADLLRRMRFTP